MSSGIAIDEHAAAGPTRDEPEGNGLCQLISVATSSDRVEEFLPAVWSALRREIVVLDHDGTPVAGALAPDLIDNVAAAVCGAGGDQPFDGWRMVRLRSGRELVGALLIRTEDPLDADEERMLEVVAGLIADQLRRASLMRELVSERAAALRRRLVTGAPVDLPDARARANQAGMRLAEYYRSAVLVVDDGEIDGETQAAVNASLRGYAHASFTVPHDPRTLVLEVAQGEAGESADCETRFALEGIAALVSARMPGANPRLIVADVNVAVTEISAQVRELLALRRYPALCAEQATSRVMPAGNFALARMLDQVDHRRAAEFVVGRLGALLAYDRASGGGLAETLEVALDWPNREEASRHAYMHRNTFRRRVKQAQDLLGTELTDPDERIAVHLALKLLRLLRSKGVVSVQRTPDHPDTRTASAAGKRDVAGRAT